MNRQEIINAAQEIGSKKFYYGKLSDSLPSYDDVILVPQHSDVMSRFGNDVSPKGRVARGLPDIPSPIISANMDTVTEHRMAITMALHGGLGIIHRLMTSDKQANEVRMVKERMRIVETDPPKLPESATVENAINLLNERRRGYVVVVPDDANVEGIFSGIATGRDFMKAGDDRSRTLRTVMTPKYDLHTVPKGTSLEESVKRMHEKGVQKMPIVDDEGKLVGIHTLKDWEYLERYKDAYLDEEGRIRVGAAIGVQTRDVERAHKLIKADVDCLALDIAHGDHDLTENMLRRLKVIEGIKTPIIAGNIATYEGALRLRDWGADAVKVGIGPGGVCETRDVAGTGFPQLSAVLFVREALKNDPDIGIIADGGIRKPGDMVKAFAAGATSVMIGTKFAGTTESPGEEVTTPDGKKQKMFRGMASHGATKDRVAMGDSTTNMKKYAAEGRTIFVNIKGPAGNIVQEYVGGLRSGMSYSGARNIDQLYEKGLFISVSPAGANEQRREVS